MRIHTDMRRIHGACALTFSTSLKLIPTACTATSSPPGGSAALAASRPIGSGTSAPRLPLGLGLSWNHSPAGDGEKSDVPTSAVTPTPVPEQGSSLGTAIVPPAAMACAKWPLGCGEGLPPVVMAVSPGEDVTTRVHMLSLLLVVGWLPEEAERDQREEDASVAAVRSRPVTEAGEVSRRELLPPAL